MFFVLAFYCVAMEPDEKIAEMRRILTEELPDDNYFIVKYVVYFLTEVVSQPFLSFI